MKILPILIYGVIAFAAGVLAAPVVQWFVRGATSGEIDCVAGVCVGAPVATAFKAYRLSDAGGLDAVVCGRGQQSVYAFWPDYVFGEGGCEEPRLIIMRSPEWQTNFEIEGGRVTKIVRHSLPTIDP